MFSNLVGVNIDIRNIYRKHFKCIVNCKSRYLGGIQKKNFQNIGTVTIDVEKCYRKMQDRHSPPLNMFMAPSLRVG